MTRLRDADKEHRVGTRAIHAGRIDDLNAGAMMPPIYQTSTYRQESLGLNRGYEYGRTQNPTREALERNVASLEGGEFGFAFGSGLATLDAILKLFKSGDHVICGENVYGGTMRQMVRIYEPLGLTFSFVDMREAEAVARALTPATRMVYCETPTNPMMFLADLAAIADICQAHGLLFAVDNTFASPIFQRPLELGADLVMHSTTKYLNGHSDMVGGIVVTRRDDLAERLGFIQNASGAVPGPMDCWLALRGTKTLPLRMARHDQNGRAIADWLTAQKAVKKIYYPGLASHPQHELAKRQMKGFGGMISFDVEDPARARRILAGTKIFALAESLGGVESLIGHPASQTHAAVPVAMREAMGLTDSLVRLSVGVEEVDDLIEDLAQAIG
ncbi:MAG: PLP-dependent aspartate aminotransferase family protein [Gemmatimonadales bacterium]